MFSEGIAQMADFLLKNNIFEFNNENKRQKSGTALAQNLYLLMLASSMLATQMETELLESQELQPFF